MKKIIYFYLQNLMRIIMVLQYFYVIIFSTNYWYCKYWLTIEIIIIITLLLFLIQFQKP